jgi:RimJ/RimL family protein N-acetyltransferase
MIVRDAVSDDLESIIAIQQNPLVMQHQYRLDPIAYRRLLAQTLNGESKSAIVSSHYSVLEDDEHVVGYVHHIHWDYDTIPLVQCGWNLAPDYWGRGLMYHALTELIVGFRSSGVRHVFADYFYGNARCARLLKKLGFVYQSIPLTDRVVDAWKMKCWRLVIRNRLDLEPMPQSMPIDSK